MHLACRSPACGAGSSAAAGAGAAPELPPGKAAEARRRRLLTDGVGAEREPVAGGVHSDALVHLVKTRAFKRRPAVPAKMCNQRREALQIAVRRDHSLVVFVVFFLQ